MDIDYNLEDEMSRDEKIIELLLNRDIAVEFYGALCNVEWYKVVSLDEEDAIIDRLKGEDRRTWSCSWRHAGGLIAAIRNENHSRSEDYMDFYCSGNEAVVSDLVLENFNRLGWRPLP
jgi:hypothetical protein